MYFKQRFVVYMLLPHCLAIITKNSSEFNKMVLEPNVSPHKQIVKDDDVKECISIEEIIFFLSESCNIPLIKFIPYQQMVRDKVFFLQNHVISL